MKQVSCHWSVETPLITLRLHSHFSPQNTCLRSGLGQLRVVSRSLITLLYTATKSTYILLALGLGPWHGARRSGRYHEKKRKVRGIEAEAQAAGRAAKGAVGAEHAYRGTSWTALALEVGKSPTAVRWRAQLPTV